MTVFILDDDAYYSDRLFKKIVEEGYQAEKYSDILDIANAIKNSQEKDIIILDIKLQAGVSGFTLLEDNNFRSSSEDNPKASLIIHSQFQNGLHFKESYKKYGAFDFIKKGPYAIEGILKALNQITSSYKTEAEPLNINEKTSYYEEKLNEIINKESLIDFIRKIASCRGNLNKIIKSTNEYTITNFYACDFSIIVFKDKNGLLNKINFEGSIDFAIKNWRDLNKLLGEETIALLKKGEVVYNKPTNISLGIENILAIPIMDPELDLNPIIGFIILGNSEKIKKFSPEDRSKLPYLAESFSIEVKEIKGGKIVYPEDKITTFGEWSRWIIFITALCLELSAAFVLLVTTIKFFKKFIIPSLFLKMPLDTFPADILAIIEGYLLCTIFFISGIGVYGMVTSESSKYLPKWLVKFNDINVLKEKLTGVIITILAVSFLGYILKYMEMFDPSSSLDISSSLPLILATIVLGLVIAIVVMALVAYIKAITNNHNIIYKGEKNED